MGITFPKKRKKNKSKGDQIEEEEVNRIHNKFDDDIEDAVNLVLAMQQDRNSINIELSFACSELPNADTFSKSDPMIVVYLKNGEEKEKIVGMTESKIDDLNPIFDKTILVSFNSKINQKLKFEVYDIDDFDEKKVLVKQELLGYIETDFSEIVYKDIWEGALKSDNRRFRGGKIKVRGIESDIGQSKIWFNLEIHDFLTKNNIYFTISGANAMNQYFKIYKSRPTKNKIKGWYFEPFRINSNQINSESDNLKFEFFELRKDKISRYLGELDITLKGMFNNVNQDIDIYKNNLIVGKLKVTNVTKDENANFFSYVNADFCLKTILALDLSLSKNLQQNSPSTFNRSFLDIVEKMKIKKPNCMIEKKIEYYKDPIEKITSVLKNFDDDSQIPVLALGAQLPPFYSITSNCFALSQDFYNPFFPNSEKIISTLQQDILKEKTLVLNGPTFFSEVLKFGKDFAQYVKQHESKYYVVIVIITDSVLKDINQFENELKECSNLPISVIICNTFDFDQIQTNENENKTKDLFNKNSEIYERIKNNLKSMECRENLHWFRCSEYQESLASMTKSVLAKIPKQFVEYMEAEGTKPKRTDKANPTKKKGNNSKKELLDKLEIRKNRNSQKTIIKKFLEFKKDNFLIKLENIGYEQETINKLRNNCNIKISAEDINLLCQIVEQLKNLDEKEKKKPIPIEELQLKEQNYLTKNNSKILFEKSNFEKTIKPKQNTDKNEYLIKLEKRQIEFIKENFSNYFYLKYSNKFPKIEKELKFDIKAKLQNEFSEKLALFLQDKNESDFFHKKQNKIKLCIFCNKKAINILFMNCGHALYCEKCFLNNKEGQVCEICEENIDFVYKNELDFFKNEESKNNNNYISNDSISYKSFSQCEQSEFSDSFDEEDNIQEGESKQINKSLEI